MRLTSVIIAVFFFNAPAYERFEALAASEKLETLLIRVSGGNVKFNVEVARTPKEQEMGLMFRRKLPKDRGMLFIYPYQSIVRMWMKNTHIPLDMVFINSKGIVKKIVERTVPFSLSVISSGEAVRAVLELNGGTSNRIGLKRGDQVIHPFFKN
ncbi:MAG: DUF192 domain-containing protein [Pseudomonadota bacterium]|nr:DUF192 domain-containing protein [Pseudomonadota bacterium]